MQKLFKNNMQYVFIKGMVIIIFVRKIKTRKGIMEVGKHGIDRIDVNDNIATIYTAGGNIFTVKCNKILVNDKVVANSRNYRRNLY